MLLSDDDGVCRRGRSRRRTNSRGNTATTITVVAGLGIVPCVDGECADGGVACGYGDGGGGSGYNGDGGESGHGWRGDWGGEVRRMESDCQSRLPSHATASRSGVHTYADTTTYQVVGT